MPKFTAMRIVSILSGIAVLFTTLAFGHLLHHYFVNAGEAAHSPPFLAGMAIGIVVGIFSLIGACLLLRSGRGVFGADFGNQLLLMQRLTRTKNANRALLCPLFNVCRRIRLTHASAILFSSDLNLSYAHLRPF